MYSIVFVHGLQGHPRGTWACDKPTQLAPQVPGGTAGHSHLLKKLFSRKQRTGLEDAHKPKVDAIYWPLDFLPDDCVNSRILTWGYDSKVSNFFGGAASQSNIRAHALNLLQALMVERLNFVSRSAIVPGCLLTHLTARETHHLHCTFFWW
jgi:ankyrin repeat domain-containing protein 50